MSGPSTASVGNATANYTVAANGSLASNATVTVTDDLGNMVHIFSFRAGGSTSQTFQLTPVSGQVGQRTLTATANPALGTPPTVSVTVYNITLTASAPSGVDGSTVSLTATLLGGSGGLTASTNAGNLSTAGPASGTPFNLTLPASGTGNAVVQVMGPGGSVITTTVAYAPAGSINPGTLSFNSGPAGINLFGTEATGGNGTFTHQIQRRVHGSGNAFVDLANGSGVTGATTLTAFDASTTPSDAYDYQLVYSDTEGSPQSATSNVVTVQVYPGGPVSGGGLVNYIGGGPIQ
jgi:hypothetical protein